MPSIRVDLAYTIVDGSEAIFTAPCNCNEIDGLKVYYPDGEKEFAFKDAHGNALTGIGELFTEGALVKTILDVTNGFAYIQNADTNAYIEKTFIKTFNGVTPDENGNVQILAAGARTILWENGDISSKFSSQTISLSLENYDAVEIVYAHWSTSSSSTYMLGATGELPVMDGWITTAKLDGDPNYPTSIKITTSGIEVTVTDREANIPYIIYGIKHGNSTGEVSYTNVLDSVGYQTNKAIMSGDEEDNTGTDLTGFIEVAGGDVIRLKNVTMPDVEGYENRVYCYRWNKSLCNVLNMTSSNTANSPVFKDGNLVQFTILDQNIKEYIGDTGWIRIGAANIDSKSVITINEEIE